MALALNVSITTRYAAFTSNKGAAPLVVQAHARATTAQSDNGVEALPDQDVQFVWDFGDPNSTERVVDPVAGIVRKTNSDQRGNHACHTYLTPGTYVVSCTGFYRDPVTGTWTQQTATSSSIVVVDPVTETGWETAYYDPNNLTSLNLGTLGDPYVSLERLRDWFKRKDKRSLKIAAGVTIQPSNNFQTLTVASGTGTFTLTYGGQTTAAIAHNASAGTVQTALENLSNIAVGDVAVTGSGGGPWLVEFKSTIPNPTRITAANASGTVVVTVIGDLFPVFTLTDLQNVRIGKYTPAGSSGSGRPVLKLNAEVTSATPVVEIKADAANDATNEVQVVTLTGSVSGGKFKLTFDGQTTADIAYDADGATVQTALEALSNIGVGDVSVAGSAAGPWTVTFQGALAAQNVPQLVAASAANPNQLTGTTPGITSTTTVYGSINHSKTNDVVFDSIDFDGALCAGSLGIDFTVGGTVGTHEDIYIRDARFANLRGVPFRMGTTLTAGNAGPQGIGLIRVNVDQTNANSAGHGIALTCMDFAALVGVSITGGNGNETNDNHVNVNTLGGASTLLQQNMLFEWCGFLGANKKNIGLNIGGGVRHVAITSNYFTGHRTAISITRASGDTGRTRPSNIVQDGNSINNMGLPLFATSRGVYIRNAINVDIRNGLFYENGYANGAAQAVGSDIEIDDSVGEETVNDTQRITITGTPTGGTFTLSFNAQTTAGIAYNANAAAVKSALEALSTIGASQLTVTGGAGPGTPWVVEFTGSKFANLNVPAIRVITNSLTGGSSPTITISQDTEGTGAIRIRHNSFYRSYVRCAAPHVEIDDLRLIQWDKNATQYMGSGLPGDDPAKSIMRFRSLGYVSPPRDEKQQIQITGTPTGGTFTLSWTGSADNTIGAQVSNPIAYNANAAAVKAALLAGWSSAASADIDVTGTNPTFVITFKTAWAKKDINAITVGTNSLTGGSSPNVSISEVIKGSTGLSQFNGNVYYAPNLVRSDTKTKPFALSDTTLVEFAAATGADWRNGGSASADDSWDLLGSYIQPGFRNPGSGNFRFGPTDPLVDANAVNVGLRYDYLGNIRTGDTDPGAFEFAGDTGDKPYVYAPSAKTNLPSASAWNYRGTGDVHYIEAGEAVSVTNVEATEVDNRPHKNLAARDNVMGAALDAILTDINNTFCAPTQAGSAYPSPHNTIESFMRVAHNPDGTIRLDGIDLSALGFLRLDGSNFMLADLNMGNGTNKIINLAPGTADTHGAQLGQVVKKVGDTMTGILTFQVGQDQTAINLNGGVIRLGGVAVGPFDIPRFEQTIKRVGDTVLGVLTWSGFAANATAINLAGTVIRGAGDATFTSSNNVGTSTDVPSFKQVISVDNEDTKRSVLRMGPHTWITGGGSQSDPGVAYQSGYKQKNGTGFGINMGAVTDAVLGAATFDGRRISGNANDITQTCGNAIFNLCYPTRGHDAANKKYVDDQTNVSFDVSSVDNGTTLPPAQSNLKPGKWVVFVHGTVTDPGDNFFFGITLSSGGNSNVLSTYVDNVPDGNPPVTMMGVITIPETSAGSLVGQTLSLTSRTNLLRVTKWTGVWLAP